MTNAASVQRHEGSLNQWAPPVITSGSETKIWKRTKHSHPMFPARYTRWASHFRRQRWVQSLLALGMSRARQPAGVGAAKIGHGKNGFSLIEAMVALTILLFMLAALAHLMTSTVLTNRQARRLTAAIHLAQDQMERLRGMNYAALASGNDGPLSEANESTGAGLVFGRTWTVLDNTGPPPPGTPPVGTRNVEVLVQWTDTDGKSHQVRLRTILGQS